MSDCNSVMNWPATLKAVVCSSVIIAIGLASVGTAQATDPYAPLRGCTRLSVDAERLACYDRLLTASVGGGGGSAGSGSGGSASAVAATVSTAPAPTAEQTFGLPTALVLQREAASVTHAPALERLEARVTAIATNGGRLIFTLDNGQEWRQFATSGDLLINVGDTVVLTPGAVGSYWLKGSSGRKTKVTRTR